MALRGRPTSCRCRPGRRARAVAAASCGLVGAGRALLGTRMKRADFVVRPHSFLVIFGRHGYMCFISSQAFHGKPFPSANQSAHQSAHRSVSLRPLDSFMGIVRLVCLLCVVPFLDTEAFQSALPVQTLQIYSNSVRLGSRSCRRKGTKTGNLEVQLSSSSNIPVNLPLAELSHRLSVFEANSVDFLRKAAKGGPFA